MEQSNEAPCVALLASLGLVLGGAGQTLVSKRTLIVTLKVIPRCESLCLHYRTFAAYHTQSGADSYDNWHNTAIILIIIIIIIINFIIIIKFGLA